MKICLFTLTYLTATFSLHAQVVSIGIQGGVPAETPLGQGTSNIPFALGPILNLRLVSGFSVETGVLFYRLGDRTESFGFPTPQNAFTFGTEQRRGKALEIPALLKYHFLGQRRTWRPFVSAGPAVRRTSLDFAQFMSVFGTTEPDSYRPLPAHTVKWNVDPVVGAGVAFKAGKVTIEPQARYSYWSAGKDSTVRKNQVQFLFGLRF